MTLKHFCHILGWQRLRRWTDVIARVRSAGPGIRLTLKVRRYDVPKIDGTSIREEIWYLPHLGCRCTKFFHREDGPAITKGDRRSWYCMGMLHRLDGPSVVWGDREWYYLDGVELTKAEWEAEAARRQ